MLVWCSKKKEFLLKELFESYGFTWVWTLNYVIMGKPTKLRGHHLFTWSTPCMWFNKGKFAPNPWIADTFMAGYGKKFSSYGNHKWAKGYEVSLCWVNSFSKPGDLVLDPYCGAGTVPFVSKKLGRNYLGIEKDEKSYKIALEQLRSIEIQAFPYQYQPDSLF
ncbi:hypothetical protein C4577_01665 [Candidatus Parcubacteria bacterium]|nr:MAG: hypothetical protein C4577_01665 [Candidatus Parcubacteria bacterium]